jgi:hypothetical protein
MRALLVVAAVGLVALGGPASAQPQASNEELARRLERLERQVDRLERELDRYVSRRPDSPRPPPQREVVAAVNELCGANCGMAAQSYCRRTGYANGVPVRIERRGIGNFEHVVQVRCFN